FGTGYASLSNLQRVPVDILKIDMSFVAALNDGAQSRELLQAILGVGEALSLAVVAEGIEDESQMEALLAMGFETGQGFLMAKPSSAEVIEARFGLGAMPVGVTRSASRRGAEPEGATRSVASGGDRVTSAGSTPRA